MTLQEAEKIFRDWQNYQEIADKLHTVFTVVPESFLPHSVETLEEALNIIAKYYFDAGNKEAAHNIQGGMGLYLGSYYISSSNGKIEATDKKLTDEEVLNRMKKDLDFTLIHPELLKARLENLKRSRDSWAEFRRKNN